MIESGSQQLTRTRDVAVAKGVEALVEKRFRFALALSLGTPRTFDIRTRAIVMPIEEQHARPEIDGVVVVAREILIETREEQLLNPRVAIGTSQCLGLGSFGSSSP